MSVIKGDLKIGQRVHFWTILYGWRNGVIKEVNRFNADITHADGICTISFKNISTEGYDV